VVFKLSFFQRVAQKIQLYYAIYKKGYKHFSYLE
jgi:hypothetical protein